MNCDLWLSRADRFITGTVQDADRTGTTVTCINCTYWSTNINSAANSQIMFQRVYSALHAFVERSPCLVFCSLLTRQICQRAEWRLAVLAAVWGRCRTWLWKQSGDYRFDFLPFASDAAVALIVLCVCVRRGRAEKALCPWLRQRADSESSVIVMSCVFSLSPRLNRRPASDIRGLGQKHGEKERREV